MLQAPRGRPGAAFLWLAVAARTMAGGTCRERPGTSSRPTCDPPLLRERVEPPGGGVAEGRGSEVRTPPLPGWDAARWRGAALRCQATLSAQGSLASFLSAHGLAP